ncbi:hypothetical protein CcaverHIS002_0302660 [Cutaneotrichosporon cavernicola]|uniref:Uncharacterized protein n=1 Tax=Cutaneotrichosporon cavernicola TaxID=279322 RepID=A0AA48IF47_9TREE|nr:uncharacterized protein CcaverHIS019_0302660 [Cutaneotrichosporon cavernicola]BEI82398.1 hypothetical protein CcaverHIS002_0302660 [Cutaneotrichosporon cavernicola]BEI90196.1 hypothetical protein CcaverHIS019_0302660 [Cutaneotrichosporon cavernicola]BEI97975.1 hypothetical protein CcaverHIS631_0302740 [Cutaneotrichosporon cavernicola]BEJ05751.1 hypothetical protein CcaverHIS641_0302730 [Cutaneotrichosporon cavernicola]
MLSRRTTAVLARAYTTASASTSAEPATPRRRQIIDTGDADLVAPPDPLSNIRPVLYAAKRRRRPSNSPYSAAEFPAEAAGSAAQMRAHELELTFTMHRERVDMGNHRFWAANNADFEAQREERLARLPPASDPPTPEDEARREAALTQFYRDWQIGTRGRQEAWVRTWWRDVWDGIKLQGRVYVAQWRAGLRG